MRLVVGADTETTGLNPDDGHKIIEIALVVYDFDTRERKLDFVKRINPLRPIDAKAQLVHGISQADLIGKPTFKAIEPTLTRILERSDLIVAHNLMFDAGFLIEEYRRAGRPLPDIQGFDTMEEGRWSTPFGKKPNLEELCFACEVDYDQRLAHAALYDVEKMMECFFFGVEHGAFNVKWGS